MISFYPGPSRVYDQVPAWVKDAYKKGILSMSHRSQEFTRLSKRTSELLKRKLKIPNDYTVFFASSATECWEIIAQSLVTSKSIHIYNGAFGAKWHDYTSRLKPGALGVSFDPQQELRPKELVFQDGEVICLTQNETSNGTQVSNELIAAIGKNNPNHVIAIDATSSMAGVYLDFAAADLWFASVQKCFGLPAGLAVMVCSPRTLTAMEKVGEKDHYNSLSYMKEMTEKWQTPCTPNVLGIYLLKRALKKMYGISRVDKTLARRHASWVKFFEKSRDLQLLIENPRVSSRTVIAVKGNQSLVDRLKAAGKKNGFLLGEGYGALRQETFRIANFPALKSKEIKALKKFLRTHTIRK